jgi:hypothetical protein
LFFDVKRKGAMRYPYIGVTGFTSGEQVDQALICVPLSGRRLMVGVLASSKTLAGMPNRWPQRYPPVREISSIFRSDPRCLNLVHYSTDHPKQFPEELCRIERLVGPRLHGFQLNIRWPDPELVEDYRRVSLLTRRPKIVLQIGPAALREVGPAQLRRRVQEYGTLIDDVLIDPSGGLGKPLKPGEVQSYLAALEGLRPGIGVAGGLSAKRLGLLDPLRQFPGFSRLSIDAEGGLRDPETDELLGDEVQNYLLASIAYFDAFGAKDRPNDHIHGGSNPSNASQIW